MAIATQYMYVHVRTYVATAELLYMYCTYVAMYVHIYIVVQGK